MKGAVTSGFQETLNANRRFVRNAKVLIGTVRAEKSPAPPCERAIDQNDSGYRAVIYIGTWPLQKPVVSQSLSKTQPLSRYRLTSGREEAKIDASPKNQRAGTTSLVIRRPYAKKRASLNPDDA